MKEIYFKPSQAYGMFSGTFSLLMLILNKLSPSWVYLAGAAIFLAFFFAFNISKKLKLGMNYE